MILSLGFSDLGLIGGLVELLGVFLLSVASSVDMEYVINSSLNS